MHTLWNRKTLCVSAIPRYHLSPWVPSPTPGPSSYTGYHLPGKVYSRKYSIKINPISVAQQHTKEQCVTCHQYSRSVVYLRTKRMAPKGCPVLGRRCPNTFVIVTHLDGRGGHAELLTCFKTDNQLIIQQSKWSHLMQLTWQ